MAFPLHCGDNASSFEKIEFEVCSPYTSSKTLHKTIKTTVNHANVSKDTKFKLKLG